MNYPTNAPMPPEELAIKIANRRSNLIIGVVGSLAFYGLFTLKHFFPDNSWITSVSYAALGILFFLNLFMSLALASLIRAIRQPQTFTEPDAKRMERLSQSMLDSYYPPTSMGGKFENFFLYCITVPYYLVVAIIFSNFPLLMCLFWSRLNNLACRNLQAYYLACSTENNG